MTEEEKIICKEFLNDADKTHSCNEYKLLMNLLEQEPVYTSQIAQKAYEDGKKDGYVQAKLEQEPILDKINKMKSEIADSLEFWDYSPNNNPLARDILETVTHFWGDIREVVEE